MTVFHDYYKFRNNVYKLGSDAKLKNFPWIVIWLVVIVLMTIASPLVSKIGPCFGILYLVLLSIVFTVFIFFSVKTTHYF